MGAKTPPDPRVSPTTQAHGEGSEVCGKTLPDVRCSSEIQNRGESNHADGYSEIFVRTRPVLRLSETTQATDEGVCASGCSVVCGKTPPDFRPSPPIQAQGEGTHNDGCSNIGVKTPPDQRPSPTTQAQGADDCITGCSTLHVRATRSRSSKRLVVATPWPLEGYNYPVLHKGRDDAITVAGRPIRPEPGPLPAPIIRPIDLSKPRAVPIDIPKRNKWDDNELWEGGPRDTSGRMIGTEEIFDDVPDENEEHEMGGDEVQGEAPQGLAALFMSFVSPPPDQME